MRGETYSIIFAPSKPRQRYPSVARIVEHPGDPEFIFDLAEGRAPEGLVEGNLDLAANGETVEELMDLLIAVAMEAKIHGIAGAQVVADHIGTHEEGRARLGK